VALAEEIYISQIDEFAAAHGENHPEHEEAETIGLLERNRRWHGELLSADNDFDQSWSVMLDSLCNYGLTWRGASALGLRRPAASANRTVANEGWTE